MRQRFSRWLWRVRRARPALPVGILLLAFAAAGIYGQWHSWRSLNVYRPFLAQLPVAERHEGLPHRQVRRLALVILDGLSDRQARRLPNLRRLAERGVWASAVAAGPTFSTPSYATWLSGLDPVDHGVRNNDYGASYRLDSLVGRARAAGLSTFAYEDGEDRVVTKLFRRDLDRIAHASQTHWREVIAAVPRHDVSLLAFDAVDNAGHSHGPEHPSYAQAAKEVDQRVGQLASVLDLRHDLIVVVNDHGHLRRGGGHGGLEPEVRRLFAVASGAAVTAAGKRDVIQQRDLAATLSALLGIASPTHNRGWIVRWMFDASVPPTFINRALAGQVRSRLRVEEHLAGRLGLDLPTSLKPWPVADVASLAQVAAAERSARGLLAEYEAKIQAAQQRLRGQVQFERILATVMLFVAVSILLAVARRLRLLQVDWFGLLLVPVAVVLTAYAGMRLLGVRPTLSFNADLPEWFVKASLPAAVATVVMIIAAARFGRRHMADPICGRVFCGAAVLAGAGLLSTALCPHPDGAALPSLHAVATMVFLRLWFSVYVTVAGTALVCLGLRRRALGQREPVLADDPMAMDAAVQEGA